MIGPFAKLLQLCLRKSVFLSFRMFCILILIHITLEIFQVQVQVRLLGTLLTAKRIEPIRYQLFLV